MPDSFYIYVIFHENLVINFENEDGHIRFSLVDWCCTKNTQLWYRDTYTESDITISNTRLYGYCLFCDIV
jgi:hypothetical protein